MAAARTCGICGWRDAVATCRLDDRTYPACRSCSDTGVDPVCDLDWDDDERDVDGLRPVERQIVGLLRAHPLSTSLDVCRMLGVLAPGHAHARDARRRRVVDLLASMVRRRLLEQRKFRRRGHMLTGYELGERAL